MRHALATLAGDAIYMNACSLSDTWSAQPLWAMGLDRSDQKQNTHNKNRHLQTAGQKGKEHKQKSDNQTGKSLHTTHLESPWTPIGLAESFLIL